MNSQVKLLNKLSSQLATLWNVGFKLWFFVGINDLQCWKSESPAPAVSSNDIITFELFSWVYEVQ